jgi:hypothetical protein
LSDTRLAVRRAAVVLFALAVLCSSAAAGGTPIAANMVLQLQDFRGGTTVSASAKPSQFLPPLATSSSYTNTFANASLSNVTLTSTVSSALIAKDTASPAKFMSGLLAQMRSAGGRSSLLDSAAQTLPARDRSGITASSVARERIVHVGDAAAELVFRFTRGGSTFDVGELWIQVGPALSLTLYRDTPPGLSVASEYALARLLAYRAGLAAAPAPTNSTAPLINGTAQVAKVLDADPGDWSAETVQFEFQWLRCSASGASCAPIPGANYRSYSVAPADQGSTLVVSVTALSPSGTGSARSQPTAVVP